MIWEVVDNSFDEAMAGFCNEITIRILPDHWVEVIDNGRGIPVDIHPKKKVSALQVLMTTLQEPKHWEASGRWSEEPR